MSDPLLRKVIRLAKEKPLLRKHLAPLIRQALKFDPEAVERERRAFLPPEVKTQPPITPEGTDLTYWSWEDVTPEQKPRYWLRLFQGKSAKPSKWGWYRTPEQRAQTIAEQIQYSRSESVGKKERLNFQHTLKVGDLLSGSFGVDEIHHRYFQVVELRGKEVVLREIKHHVVSEGELTDQIVPAPDHFTGDPPVIKVPGPFNVVKIDHMLTVAPWSGKPGEDTHSHAGY